MSALEWLDAVRADLDALTRSRHIASSSGLTSDELTEAWKAVLSLEGHVATIAPDRLDKMERALRGVLEVHRPIEVEPSDTLCAACSNQLPNGRFLPVIEWPCPTVTTIKEVLGDE